MRSGWDLIEGLVGVTLRWFKFSPQHLLISVITATEKGSSENTIPPDAMPFKTGLTFTYDSGEFEKNMDLTMVMAGYTGFEARRAESKSRGKLRGIGMSNTIERAGNQRQAQQPIAVGAAMQPDATPRDRFETETAVIARIADQQHPCMPLSARLGQGMGHQRHPQAAPVLVGRHRDRAQQQRRCAGADQDRPEPDGRLQDRILAHDETEAGERRHAVAQAIGGLALARGAKRGCRRIVRRNGFQFAEGFAVKLRQLGLGGVVYVATRFDFLDLGLDKLFIYR